MSERKIGGRKIAVFAGIACIVLVAGLFGTVAASRLPMRNEGNIISSLISQISALRNEIASLKAQINDTQSWSEGVFNFNLRKGANTQFTISTGGFRTVSISISSYYNSTPTAYRVFVGFITANQTLNDQQYTVQAFSPSFLVGGPTRIPWFSTAYWAEATGLTQTYNVSFSKVTVWIWDNSTTSGIYGNVYYYLTK